MLYAFDIEGHGQWFRMQHVRKGVPMKLRCRGKTGGWAEYRLVAWDRHSKKAWYEACYNPAKMDLITWDEREAVAA